MTTTVVIEGQEFLIGPFANGGQSSFHVFRRLMPFGKGLFPLLASGAREKLYGPPMIDVAPNGGGHDSVNGVPAPPPDNTQDGVPEELISILGSVFDTLAQMSDDQVDYVVNSCLAAVKFKTAGNWQNLVAANGRLLYQPADALDFRMALVAAVLKENLANFSLPRLLSTMGLILPGTMAEP